LVSSAIFFATGEVALRMIFWDGISFSGHRGSLVRRFEKDFQFNRFDGPCRGPEFTGPAQTHAIRLLVQGDSITWGQGIKLENHLYTHHLLEKLRSDSPSVEMAVLASGGREIDGHLEQLRKWGDELRPSVIIYQWFINDIELNKAHRPRHDMFWRHLFFHRILVTISDSWFFLDYSLARLLPLKRPYEDYIATYYASDGEHWNEFVGVFQAWATVAKALTPRVLVALYPSLTRSGFPFAEIHSRMRAVSEERDIETLEFIDWFDEFSDDHSRMRTSRYDGHPNERVHSIMADALHERLLDLWPELFAGKWERPPRG
jgi:lysophospholipase L1-like esterase